MILHDTVFPPALPSSFHKRLRASSSEISPKYKCRRDVAVCAVTDATASAARDPRQHSPHARSSFLVGRMKAFELLFSFLVATSSFAAAQRPGAYEAELYRRQQEYQQQLMRAQAQKQMMEQQAQQRGYQQQPTSAQAQKMHAQQLMYEAMQAQARREQMGGGAAQAMQGKPMTKQQKKAIEKRNAEAKKQQKTAAAARAKLMKQQSKQRSASMRGQMGMQRAERGGGPLKAVLSVKGLVVCGTLGYLATQQRELLLKFGLQMPLMILRQLAKTAWTVVLKPLIRKLLLIKGGGGGGAPVGELPGGSY